MPRVFRRILLSLSLASLSVAGLSGCSGSRQQPDGGDYGGIDPDRSTVTVDRSTGVVAEGIDFATITVTVRDAAGTSLVGHAVILAATGSGNTIVQPSGPSDSNGVATGTIASTVAGVKTITAIVEVGGKAVVLSERPTIAFVAPVNPPVRLAFAVEPTDAAKRAVIAPAVRIAVRDAAGATVTTATNAVTIRIGTNPGAAALSGTLTTNAVDGIATFDDLALDQFGAGYTLLATSPNLTSATSTSFEVTDTIPPGPVTDLAVATTTTTSVTLTWTAPGDDGGLGTAAAYVLRYSLSPITEASFADATQVAPIDAPQAPGTPELLVVSGLSLGTTYYFGLLTTDRAGNGSYAFVAGYTQPCPTGYTGSTCGECAAGFHLDGDGHCTALPAILTFAFATPAADADIDQAGYKIDLRVPHATDLGSLVASFTTTPGAAVTVSAVPQTSGATANDFSTAVEYTLTAPDLSSTTYTVSVRVMHLVDTGQVSCFDPSGNPIGCTGTGQDGAYPMNPLAFTDNGDGTITDEVTGLVWQKCTNGQSGADCSAGTATAYNLFEAVGACRVLTLAGGGWRVPTLPEEIALVNYELGSLSSTYFPFSPSVLWSSTPTPGLPIIDPNAMLFHTDGSAGDGLIGASGATFPVRCVRGTSPLLSPPISNGDGTVTDSSNLAWQECPAGLSGVNCSEGSPLTFAWSQALSYCQGLTLGGHSDWRLPNAKELEFAWFEFNDPYSRTFWTSTSIPGSANAWTCQPSRAVLSIAPKEDAYPVRCVR